MGDKLRIAVGGALGRMGQAVLGAARERPGVDVVAAFDRPDAVGDDAGGLKLTAMTAALEQASLVIDFSTGPATAALAREAARRGGDLRLVIGATGLTVEEDAEVAQAANRIAIVKSGNYAIGVNVLAGLVEQAARRLGPDIWDIEIVETHHRRKVDAPSGTALMLGEAAARGRGHGLSDAAIQGRHGLTGPRPAGAIGFASLRGGDVVGEHSVMFAADDEVITLQHSARSRAMFARGAIEAGVWVAARPPGLYDMMDVLGFRGGSD